MLLDIHAHFFHLWLSQMHKYALKGLNIYRSFTSYPRLDPIIKSYNKMSLLAKFK